MIFRLTDLIKNSINNFLSQELSPDEIEEKRLNEGLRLKDVNKKQHSVISCLDFSPENWEEYLTYLPWDDSIYDGTLDFRNTLTESSIFDD